MSTTPYKDIAMSETTYVKNQPIKIPISKSSAILQIAIMRFNSEWSLKLSRSKKFKYYANAHRKPHLGFSFTEIKQTSPRNKLKFEKIDNASGCVHVTLSGEKASGSLNVNVEWSEVPEISDIFISTINKIRQDRKELNSFVPILTELYHRNIE